MNALKQKIKNHEKLIGMHVNFNDVGVARLAGLAGYDYIWVDLEHSYLSLENLMSHIIAIQTTGTAVIVRVPQDDMTYTKKVLEMGVDGIIFPMIRSAEQAKKLIDFTLYPPYGNRGFGPLNAVDFGYKDILQYVAETNDNLCRFIQIEHKDAVECLEELIAIDAIDAYIFGANDLSGSIGELCNVFGENTQALIQESIRKLRAADKFIGLSTGDYSSENLKFWSDMGIDMISAGADFDFIRDGARANRDNMARIIKNQG